MTLVIFSLHIWSLCYVRHNTMKTTSAFAPAPAPAPLWIVSSMELKVFYFSLFHFKETKYRSIPHRQDFPFSPVTINSSRTHSSLENDSWIWNEPWLIVSSIFNSKGLFTYVSVQDRYMERAMLAQLSLGRI